MRRDHLLPLLITVVICANCSSPKESESTGVWVNKEKIQGKSYNKIFIVVMTADIEARAQIENDLAATAAARGHQTIKSVDAIPPSLNDPKAPTKEEVVSKVKESGCDGVLVASLLKKEEDVHYTPGGSAYSIQPYYTYYPGYYSHWYPSVSTPDYYSHEKSYFMQSNFYDVASEEIMWSVQSTVFNPSDLQKFSKAYTTGLIKQLEKAKILKK